MAHNNDARRRSARDRANGKYIASRKRFSPLSPPEPDVNQHTNGVVAALPPAMVPDAESEVFAAEVRDSNGSVRREIVTPPTRGARYLRFSLPQRAEREDAASEERLPLSALDIESAHRSLWQRTRELLIGAPIPTENASHERVGKAKALAILSSDALSSVAYGTEASLAILVTAGIGLELINVGIGAAIIVLLAIVAFSYRQTIKHYPTGGGSYIVAKAHLGVTAGLVAAAALLLDYILTVSVSVSAGVDAITSAFRELIPYSVLIGVAFIALIVLINLRGVRESGSIFAIPTYLFVGSYLLTIIIGFGKAIFQGGLFHALAPGHTNIPLPHSTNLSLFLLLTAFASGCSAMTGTEAIADGVPIFKGATPAAQSRNAATTLSWMATLLALMFGGTTYLAWRFGVLPQLNSHPTLLAQIATLIWQDFGAAGSWFFYLFQIATALILTLAANTSFSDFPRLSSILARDDYMPHLFGLRGDRLAFNTGILVLGVLSAALLMLFAGNTDALINLYALGVFTAFTLSQLGMVGRWRTEKEPGWRRGAIISGIGAFATGIVTLIIVISKTPRGAWVVLLLVPLIVLMFQGIHRHYAKASVVIAEMPVRKPGEIRHLMIVPVASLNKLALRGLSYARSITPHVIAVHIALDPSDKQQIWHDWDEMVKNKKFLRGGPVPENDLDEPDAVPTAPQLIVIDSPYRVLGRPVINYIDKLHREFPDDMITVVLPEFVATHFLGTPAA